MADRCRHDVLWFKSSSYASQTKYKRVDGNRLVAATTPSSRVPADVESRKLPSSTFPAPLVLPGDELAWDGNYPPQSLRSWIREPERNEVTSERGTLYVVGPPTISAEVVSMGMWKEPQTGNESGGASSRTPNILHPRTEDIAEYFGAFFHGMDVKLVDEPWRFAAWKGPKGAGKPDKNAVSLETHESGVRIRTRASRDGCFDRQLNLSDLLDACIEALPDDAYSILLLVEQDMYEDDDDDFCCGRAFGGSRVAVVSTARYNPLLDEYDGVDRGHAWPASHCNRYLCTCDDTHPRTHKSRKLPPKREKTPESTAPMDIAVREHSALESLVDAPSIPSLEGLWLGRVCKTATHEVGHCLGMDHCVYYACLMQGTANVNEDARQPPFLCPVDLAKLTRAAGTGVSEQYEALLAFCEKRPHIHLFAAFAGWLRGRLVELSS